MSKIFCIVGKSASGKDTMYKKILSSECHPVPIVPYTTRPMRYGEKNGVDYNFVTEEQLREFERDGLVIEKRCYKTTQGVWSYFTLKFNLENGSDYILITTPEGAVGITEHYGADTVHIVYLVLDDKTRLLRCIERESVQKSPDYEEVCRRFIADRKDFSECGIENFKNVHYIDTNRSQEECLNAWNEIYNTEKN